MSPFEVLGLPSDAEEIDIKRAYARLLKHNRPEDDAGAFQHLHGAYTDCLAWMRERKLAEDFAEDEITASQDDAQNLPGSDSPERTPAELPLRIVDGGLEAAPAQNPLAPPLLNFDRQEFVDDLMQRSMDMRPQALSRWLQAQEPLYSVQLKASLRPFIAQTLAECETPPPSAALNAILAFFGLDQVTSQAGLTGLVVSAIERSEGVERFDRVWQEYAVKEYAAQRYTPVDRLILRELQGPFSWWRRLFLLLTPMIPKRVSELSALLQSLDFKRWRQRVDQGSAAFWQQATDRTALARPRWMLAAMRTPLYAFCISLLMNLMTGPPIALELFVPLLLWFGGGWLAYALFFVVKHACQRRWRWDHTTSVCALLLCIALAALPFSRALSACAFGFLAFIWTAQRKEGLAWIAFFTAVSGAALCAFLLAPLHLSAGWLSAAICAAAFASLWLHDFAYARRHRIPVLEANLRQGWLGWWLAAQVVACISAVALLGTG